MFTRNNKKKKKLVKIIKILRKKKIYKFILRNGIKFFW